MKKLNKMIQFQNNTKKFKKSKAVSEQNGIFSEKIKIDVKKFSAEKKSFKAT